MKLALTTLLLLASAAYASDSIPGAKQTNPIAIIGGTIHPASSAPVENATLLFENGKITAIGTALSIPDNATKIDAKGKHVYPGLIQGDSQLGLTEISSVRATNDTTETGSLNPNVRAERAVNPDSELIPVARANGILVSIVAPTGGQLSGQSAAIRLDGWTFEDMTLKAPTGLHVNWPQISPGPSGGRRSRGATGGSTPPPNIDPLKDLRELFATARAYKAARSADAATPHDSKWESMLSVLEGKIPLVVETDSAEQIASAVAFTQKENLKLIITGGYEADRVAPLLKETNTPVVIIGTQRSPRHRGDAYDAPFTLPARLRDAGVKFAIAADRGASAIRNLPYHAATAAGHGLSREEALRAITLSPAEIFNISDSVGSLEPGKEATLFIANGDILDTPTQVTQAWTQGRAVDLSSRHTRLWKKYEAKYEQEKSAK